MPTEFVNVALSDHNSHLHYHVNLQMHSKEQSISHQIASIHKDYSIVIDSSTDAIETVFLINHIKEAVKQRAWSKTLNRLYNYMLKWFIF